MGSEGIGFNYIPKLKNCIPSEKDAERLRALCQCLIIADYYNDGWKPKFDGKEGAYFLFLVDGDMSPKCGIRYEASYGLLPMFKSVEIAMEAYNNNKEIFDTYLRP